MGLQLATEDGPYRSPDDIKGERSWPYGLKIKTPMFLKPMSNGIHLHTVRKHLSGPHSLPGSHPKSRKVLGNKE